MAEEHRCQAPEGHRLCVNNCGFLGSPATMNLCSKCYRDFRLKEQQQASSAKSSISTSPSSSSTAVESVSQVPLLTLPEVKGVPPVVSAVAISPETGRVDRIQVQVRDYVLRVTQVPGKSWMHVRFQEDWARGRLHVPIPWSKQRRS
ncbi:hypothetical protein GOBAR_DD16398 [Gossypium barbadense]|nr:hypothetical protein GOBAR_DD16398 [Gossypium barbadense]